MAAKILTEPQRTINRMRRLLTKIEFELMEEKPDHTVIIDATIFIANEVLEFQKQIANILKG